jgi:hypothetical protein
VKPLDSSYIVDTMGWIATFIDNDGSRTARRDRDGALPDCIATQSCGCWFSLANPALN